MTLAGGCGGTAPGQGSPQRDPPPAPHGVGGERERAPLVRWLGSQYLRASGRIQRNRAELHGGASGLRIVAFHGTPPAALRQLTRVVDEWRARWEVASPTDADDLVAGRWQPGPADRLLITFDDGLRSNFDAAVWLAQAGVRAIFFVIPSLVDRSIAAFVRYHQERGVTAVAPVPDGDDQGLSSSQVREMVAMGHRIGAHNFAHRDLGRLHDPDELGYEIDRAIDTVGELTGQDCTDFAVGFGQPHNLSTEAAAHADRRFRSVFMCHRGLNVPGASPRFLLRHSHMPGHTLAFTRVCLEGGADHLLYDRAEDMKRRVGALPGGPVPPR